MSKYSKQLKEIDEQASSMLNLLIEWSQINSGSRNVDGLAKMLNALKTEFEKLDGELKVIELGDESLIDSNGNLVKSPLGKALSISKRPNAKLKVFLCGHMDTVFPADSDFQKAELIKDNVLNGPGVADLKGGLIVMLKALEALESLVIEKNLQDEIGWEILINPDEEIGSPGSAELLIQSAKRNHLGLIFEPSLPDGSIVGERKGSGNFELVVKGKSSHAGREFDQGRNAIIAASEFITRAHKLNQINSNITLNIGNIEGGGPVNIVPDLAICRFNIRTLEIADEKECFDYLNKLITEIKQQDGITAELHGQFNRKPKKLDSKIMKLYEMVEACAKNLNISTQLRSTGGCCDGNNLAAAGLPNLDTLGVRGGDIHSDKEYVLVDSITERAKLSALLLMKLANGELNW